MMLSIQTVEIELDKVSYKPGWSFLLYETPWEGWWISIRFEPVDAYHLADTQPQNVRTPLPPFQTLQQFHTWLMWRIGRMEIHEMREFYRVSGEVYDDPHIEDANHEGKVV
jgi:hypothetical protein